MWRIKFAKLRQPIRASKADGHTLCFSRCCLSTLGGIGAADDLLPTMTVEEQPPFPVLMEKPEYTDVIANFSEGDIGRAVAVSVLGGTLGLWTGADTRRGALSRADASARLLLTLRNSWRFALPRCRCWRCCVPGRPDWLLHFVPEQRRCGSALIGRSDTY